MLDITEDDFSDVVLNSDRPVLVDVAASWCAPCHKMAPMLTKLESVRKDVHFVKIDADESPQTLKEYDIRSIPTLLIFRDGQVVDRRVGASSGVESWLDNALS